LKTSWSALVLVFGIGCDSSPLPWSQVTYATGKEPLALVMSDVNGDSKPDLVFANHLDGSIGVLLNRGDGTFESQSVYEAGVLPDSVADGDWNGDGAPDLAVANWGSDSIGMLMNRGDGTFGAQTSYHMTSPSWVGSGDFNHDGKVDATPRRGVSDRAVAVKGNARRHGPLRARGKRCNAIGG